MPEKKSIHSVPRLITEQIRGKFRENVFEFSHEEEVEKKK